MPNMPVSGLEQKELKDEISISGGSVVTNSTMKLELRAYHTRRIQPKAHEPKGLDTWGRELWGPGNVRFGKFPFKDLAKPDRTGKFEPVEI